MKSEDFKTTCKEWVGDKPCQIQKSSEVINCKDCIKHTPYLGNTLIMEAGGLGSILRSTVVSKELKRINPDWRIQWLTHEKGADLLKHIPSVDNVILTSEPGNLYILQGQEFNSIINFESGPLYLALTKILKAEKKFGLQMNKFGLIEGASEQSPEFLRLQTDDYFRKRLNNKSMQRILLEIAGFDWNDQTYDLYTSPEQDVWAIEYLSSLGAQCGEKAKVIGFNIGSSRRNDAKRLPVQKFIDVAQQFISQHPEWKIVILAGPEDDDVYNELFEARSELGKNVIFSGNQHSISQYISLVNQIPIHVSADTFGMHVAIALKKNVISLHGPQPQQEIILSNNKNKIHLNLDCSPCFTPRVDRCTNSQRLQCMREISVDIILNALENEIKDF